MKHKGMKHWVVDFWVADCWTEDGFDMTDEIAKEMIAHWLDWAHEDETDAKVRKSEEPRS